MNERQKKLIVELVEKVATVYNGINKAEQQLLYELHQMQLNINHQARQV